MIPVIKGEIQMKRVTNLCLTMLFLVSAGVACDVQAKSGVMTCAFSSPVQVSFDNSPLIRTGVITAYFLEPNGTGVGGEPQSGSTRLDVKNLMPVRWVSNSEGGYIRIQGQNSWFSDSVSLDLKSRNAVFTRLSLGAIGFVMKGECSYVN